jgi:prolyl-tRNA editing enzyme YbaK/EbsC (Cys-tRNA(Pro) deacylase)
VHANSDRVAAALLAAGAAGQVRELTASARTAAEAATALGVDIGAIVKSLVFTADGIALLVLAGGDHQVDTTAVAHRVGAAAVTRATPELVREATGFPIGGVAPVGHPAPLRTLVDRQLARFEVVWAAAGTPHTVFPTSLDELVRLTKGSVADIAAAPRDPARTPAS